MLGESDEPVAAEAAHHRDHRGHAVLHGRDGSGPVRRRRAGRDQGLGQAGQAARVVAAFRRRCKPFSPRASTVCATTRRICCKLLPCSAANSSSVSRRAVAGQSEEELERLLANLQLGEFVYEQPSISDVEYIFKHALTQEVAYNSILHGAPQATARGCGARHRARCTRRRLDDHLADLAHHYSRSANQAKAVEYLRLAGVQAMSRGRAASSRAEPRKRARAC